MKLIADNVLEYAEHYCKSIGVALRDGWRDELLEWAGSLHATLPPHQHQVAEMVRCKALSLSQASRPQQA